jgi:ABC-type enterobactin transport system permease subunit
MILLVLAVLGSLGFGRVNIPFATVLKILCSTILPLDQDWSATAYSVVMDVRRPRILAGILVGAALSISGASFQGVFQNPLVSPHILGVGAPGRVLTQALLEETYGTPIRVFSIGDGVDRKICVPLLKNATPHAPKPTKDNEWKN